jgi:hypothetical protein
MATLNPILTATPGNPLTYNVGMAETFSWVPVENDAERPIYARATYLVNASDISGGGGGGTTDNTLTNSLLTGLTSSNVQVAGFSIPPYDEINLSYVGSTEYLNKVSYLKNTTEVLALSFVYVTEPPTSSDNRILKVKKL